MPNTYFQFKQFTVHQDQCAMRVSTEACILGAWVPDNQPKRILDIGTGTGLLSLMLAQRMNAPIDAVELDEKAASQARLNVEASHWGDLISVIRDNIFSYAKSIDHQYDLIISNPPFFTDGLQSEVAKKNLAKHDTSFFNKTNLAESLRHLLSNSGIAYVLYPEFEAMQFMEEVKKIGLFYASALIIRNQPSGPVFRKISAVSKSSINFQSEELNIREGREHSTKFNQLMQPYYLKL